MKAIAIKACALLVASMSFMAMTMAMAMAAETSTPSIKDVMAKLNKGPSASLAKLKTDLNAATPNWENIEANAKEYLSLSEALAKNTPSKGSKESWAKLCQAYIDDAKALDTAAKSHDTTAAKNAHQRLAASCKSCHGAHKGK